MSAALNIHDAKTHFSRVVARAEAGEEVIISRAGKPVAKVVPIKLEDERKRGKREGGWLRGVYPPPPDDIDTPFEKDIEAMFYGDEDARWD